MVGCCFCRSKPKRVEQLDSRRATTHYAFEPGEERLKQRTQSKSTQSHGKKHFISEASGSKNQLYNAVNSVYTEPSDTTLRASTVAADSYVNNTRSESPSELFPNPNRNKFPLNVKNSVERKEKELTPSEKLFLKYKTQMKRNDSVDEEFLYSDDSDSLSHGPIRNICTRRCRAVATSHNSHASKKVKHSAAKESNLLEFPKLDKYKHKVSHNKASFRPIGKDEVPKGYGPPEGALLSASRKTTLSKKRTAIPSGTYLKSGQPSFSAGQGRKTTKNKVKPLLDTAQASTPLERPTNDLRRMNDFHVKYSIPAELRTPEPSTLSDQSDRAESQPDPLSMSQQTSSVSHSEWSGSESAAVSSGPTQVSPGDQSPSIISGSFTPSNFDLDARDEAGIRHRQHADVIFHHNPDSAAAHAQYTLPATKQLPDILKSGHKQEISGRFCTSEACIPNARPIQLQTPLPTPVSQNPSARIPPNAENSRDTPVEPQHGSSISSSLTSFPEDEPLPTKKAPKKTILKSHRRKSTVEDTLNQIARDLRRQNRVLESYRKVLQQGYPVHLKKRPKKSQTKQATSLQREPSTVRDHHTLHASRSDISSIQENNSSLDRPSDNLSGHSSKVVKSSHHRSAALLDSRSRRRRQRPKSNNDSSNSQKTWHHIE